MRTLRRASSPQCPSACQLSYPAQKVGLETRVVRAGRLEAPHESGNHCGVNLEPVCFLLAAGVDNIMTVTVHRCKPETDGSCRIRSETPSRLIRISGYLSFFIFLSRLGRYQIKLNHILTNLINIIILSENTVPNTRHRQRHSDRAIVEQHDRQDSSARSASMTAAAIAMMTVSIMRKKI